jgi:hypothetical protein
MHKFLLCPDTGDWLDADRRQGSLDTASLICREGVCIALKHEGQAGVVVPWLIFANARIRGFRDGVGLTGLHPNTRIAVDVLAQRGGVGSGADDGHMDTMSN